MTLCSNSVLDRPSSLNFPVAEKPITAPDEYSDRYDTRRDNHKQVFGVK